MWWRSTCALSSSPARPVLLWMSHQMQMHDSFSSYALACSLTLLPSILRALLILLVRLLALPSLPPLPPLPHRHRHLLAPGWSLTLLRRLLLPLQTSARMSTVPHRALLFETRTTFPSPRGPFLAPSRSAHPSYATLVQSALQMTWRCCAACDGDCSSRGQSAFACGAGRVRCPTSAAVSRVQIMGEGLATPMLCSDAWSCQKRCTSLLCQFEVGSKRDERSGWMLESIEMVEERVCCS